MNILRHPDRPISRPSTAPNLGPLSPGVGASSWNSPLRPRSALLDELDGADGDLEPDECDELNLQPVSIRGSARAAA